MAHILNILSIEEDELMSSYFKRMARANGFSNPKHFMQAYVWPDSTIGVKQRRAIRDDGFNVLLNFNKCLRNDVSLINFFLRTSLFPGLRPVISNADAIVLYVFRDNTNDIDINPKIYCQRPQYCPLCSLDDYRTKGYTWLRRSHNMPGVKVCHKHHCYLSQDDGTGKYNTEAQKTENTTEIGYSIFAHDMLTAMIDCNNQHTIDAVKKKITELGYEIPRGGYSDFVAACLADKYQGFLPDNTERVLKTHKKDIVHSENCEIMLKILYVLFQTTEGFRQYVGHDRLFEPKGYDILEYRDGLYRLQHKCGKQIIVTQETFEKGWKCVCRKKQNREQNVNVHIRSAGNKKYDIIAHRGNNVVLKHKNCGKEQEYSPYRFVLDDIRCTCERKRPISEIRQEINSFKDFKLVSYENLNKPMTIRHTICGKTFEIGYYDFKKAPYCRACYQKKIGIDIKITPRSINESTESSFIQDIADLVGDEYIFVGPYRGDNEYTYIRHKKCDTIERYIPSHFRQGIRCKKCAIKTSLEGFSKYVEDLTSGEYSIVDRDHDSYFFIKNTYTGQTFSLRKPVIMQELNRVQPSIILPVKKRNNIDVSAYALQINNNHINNDYEPDMKKLWQYIQDSFTVEDLFGMDDLPTNRYILSKLAHKGKIKRVYTGLYTYSDNNATAIDIIKYKYYLRHGNRFGYWFGQSFAYHLGLIDKPKTVYISTNKMQTAERSSITVLDQPLVLRRPITTITEDNYKILAVIDYLTTYKKGYRGIKRVDKRKEITALRNYIAEIKRDEFEAYTDNCADSKLLNHWLDIIYADGLLQHINSEFSKDELFHPDDVNVDDAAMMVLVKAGELQKVYKRLYAFPGRSVTAQDIVEYKYLKRHNTRLGYWYGESFMHYLGLCKEPEKFQVVSGAFNGNLHHYRNSEERYVLDKPINFRKPLIGITEDNYRILCVIDFLAEYSIGTVKKGYFYPHKFIDLTSTLTAISSYLQGIQRADFEQYIHLVKNQDALRLCLDLVYMHQKWDRIASSFGNSIFGVEDVGYSKEMLRAYSRTGIIKNVYEGLFAQSDVIISVEDIVNYKYRIHNNIRIGYWFGSSFAYFLGLIEKPDNYSIVSNLASGGRGRRGRSEYAIMGKDVIVRYPIAEITEDNYKILCVIDYVTTYRKAFYADEHIEIKKDLEALRNFIKEVSRNAFKKYEDLCESKTLLNKWLDMIYEGL